MGQVCLLTQAQRDRESQTAQHVAERRHGGEERGERGGGGGGESRDRGRGRRFLSTLNGHRNRQSVISFRRLALIPVPVQGAGLTG